VHPSRREWFRTEAFGEMCTVVIPYMLFITLIDVASF